MSEKQQPAPLYTALRERQVFRDGDRVLLTVTRRVPRLTGEGRGVRRISRYYECLSRSWQKRWKTVLLPRLKASDGGPCTASLDFTVTFEDDDRLSLLTELREQEAGKKPRRLRFGDIWRLSDGVPLTPRQCTAPHRRDRFKKAVLQETERQIEERIASGDYQFYEDHQRLCRRFFSQDRMYLTPEGLVLFYPVCSIAPSFEGFPAFLLPDFSDLRDGTSVS